MFEKKIKIGRSLCCAAFAAGICFLYNFIFILNKITATNADDLNFAYLATEILLNFFLIFSAIYFASFKKIIFKIVIIFILLLSGTAAYALNKFGVLTDQTVIANLFDNVGDFGDVLIFSDVFLYVFLYIFIPSFFLSKLEIINDANKKTFFIIALFFVIFAALLSSFNHQIRKGVIFAYPPLSLINASLEYFQEIHFSKKESANLAPINDIVKAKILHKSNNLKIVLVIGESARTDHFSINGYDKKTTPQIEKISHFLSFKNVTPCHNVTRYSVACMLSREHSKDFKFPLKEESIIKVFDDLKFSTSWLSTQKAVGDNNTLMLLALQAQNFYFGDHVAAKIGGNMVYDEYLLDDLKQELARPRDSFIILHTQGSHFLFDDRYPEKFKNFSPTCNNKDLQKCSAQQIANSYDNTIFYTDFFINSVVNELKTQNALMIYISDHGQFLGENGLYYHGPTNSHTKQEHKVPMFLWMSDKLLTDKFYKEKFNNAARNIGDKLSHDDLFGSLLDCSGVGYGVEKNSVCSK